MKKIFVLSVFAIFAFVINANAQCSGCGQTQQQPILVVSNPKIFTPKPVGIETPGTAYLEYAPHGGNQLSAIVYLYAYSVDANGNKVVIGTTTQPITGKLLNNRPGYWPDVFEIPGSFDPVTRRYYTPKEVPFTYSSFYVKDDNGKIIGIKEVYTF